MTLTVPVARPGRMVTAALPSWETATTALLARTWPAPKLRLLVAGAAARSAAKARRYPAAPAPVTVRFADTARAVAGMPQRPARAKLRSAPAARAGPAQEPAGFRVSSTRHGGRV